VAAEKVREINNRSLGIAVLEGDVEEKGAVMAGQIVPLVTEIKNAKDIINDVLKRYHETVSNIAKFEV